MRELILPWPDRALHPNSRVHWSKDEDAALASWLRVGKTYREISEAAGRPISGVRNRAWRLALLENKEWTPEEVQILTAAYASIPLNAGAIAEALGRSIDAVQLKAGKLGLTNAGRPKKRPEDRIGRAPPMFSCPEALREHQSRSQKDRLDKNGHPRGALGMRHTDATRARLSVTSAAAWERKSEEERQAAIDKSLASRAANGTHGARKTSRGSWKAGWREFGGKRNFYRSRWEANYARYLQWLKEAGHISEWAHEPETFWFEGIKRGVRSYKPDFRVWEVDGSSALHEVKGWMDSRSRTCLRRMAKYHPNEKLVLIDGPQYRSIRKKVMRLIDGWEDSARDSHA